MCSTKESYSWTLLIFFKFIDNIKKVMYNFDRLNKKGNDKNGLFKRISKMV